MGEARTVCPSCRRRPGHQHDAECPRSIGSQAAIALASAGAGAGRLVYPGHGAFVTDDGSQGYNPGVPRVVGRKPRKAGGMPKGIEILPEGVERDGTVRYAEVSRLKMAALFLREFPELGR